MCFVVMIYTFNFNFCRFTASAYTTPCFFYIIFAVLLKLRIQVALKT